MRGAEIRGFGSASGASQAPCTFRSFGRSVRAADSSFGKSAIGTPHASSTVTYAQSACFAAAAFWAGWMKPGCSSETTSAARDATFATMPRASSRVRGRKKAWVTPRAAHSCASSRAHSIANV
jgi:hypothetical protein